MPVDMEVIMGQCTEELTSDCVAAITQAVETQDSNSPSVCPVFASLQCIAVSEEMHKTFSAAEIRQAQQDDVNISQIIQCKLSNKKPAGHDLNALSNQSKCLLREWERLHMDEDGILRRKTTNNTACFT